MQIRFLPLAFLLIASSRGFAGETVGEIIESSIKAQGGYEAIASIKSVKRKGAVNLTALGQSFLGPTEVILIPWQKAYQSYDLGIQSQKQGWNGSVAWEDGRQGLRRINGREAGAVRLQSVLHPLLGHQMLAMFGLAIERLPDESIEGKNCHVLETALGADGKLRIYIDAETRLVRRYRIAAYNAQLGSTVHLNIDQFDYAVFGSVKLPTRTRVALGEILTIETTYTQTEIDAPIDDGIFDMPKAGSTP